MARDVVEFMRQWAKLYPSLAGNPFWLAGESYAGGSWCWQRQLGDAAAPLVVSWGRAAGEVPAPPLLLPLQATTCRTSLWGC